MRGSQRDWDAGRKEQSLEMELVGKLGLVEGVKVCKWRARTKEIETLNIGTYISVMQRGCV